MTNRKLLSTRRAMSLQEVAKEMGISVDSVRKIESSALYKLKKAMKANGLSLDSILPDSFGAARV